MCSDFVETVVIYKGRQRRFFLLNMIDFFLKESKVGSDDTQEVGDTQCQRVMRFDVHKRMRL